ncbi:MAG: (2Fe-2S) ferredoxin domain-containing protein [Spirochaetales bacterium]|nr:(2Fe-2S) ferredoxin domain-containing protein [Spirochaetales bacterium]
MKFEKHLFVCENVRQGGERPSCGGRGGAEVRQYLKARVKDLDLKGVRINMSGCLDQCEEGPVSVLYPEGRWVQLSNREQAEAFLQAHLRPSH